MTASGNSISTHAIRSQGQISQGQDTPAMPLVLYFKPRSTTSPLDVGTRRSRLALPCGKVL
jgi:hypothetical protein